MTDGNPRPDEEPIPPTSTEWSRAAGGDDDDLAPPFIPGSSEAGAPGTAPPEAPPTPPDPSEARPAAGAGEGEFPVQAFDIEGGEETPGAAPGSEVEEPGSWQPPDAPAAIQPTWTAAPDAADELADRLEDMARRLRQQGPEAAEAGLSSPDRFTALLAGLLAGYLAGRD